MPATHKNLVLGIAVAGSLVMFAGLIVKFGKLPAELFTPPHLSAELHAVRADGIGGGSPIYYRGVNVGTVEGVALGPNDAYVVIYADLKKYDLPPSNVVGRITKTLLGGAAAINLELPPGATADGIIHEGQIVQADYAGNDVLPPAFTELAVELRQTVQEFRRSNLIGNVNDAIKDIRVQVDHAGVLIEHLDHIVGDDKTRSDLRQAVANIRSASESVDRIGADLEQFSQGLQKTGGKLNVVVGHADTLVTDTHAHIDDLYKQLGDRLDQISRLLGTVQSIALKVDSGKGTAGMLVNNGQLYQGLADTVGKLDLTVGDLRRLIDQWEQEGVYLRLTK